jgi:putative membrane protein
VVALVLAFLNSVVKPVFVLLTLPITVVTLGLFLLVINVLLIYAASGLVDGFRVDGFITALLFSIIISIGRGLGDALLSSKKDKE